MARAQDIRAALEEAKLLPNGDAGSNAETKEKEEQYMRDAGGSTNRAAATTGEAHMGT